MTLRILHSADWHLGRRFERNSLEDDQKAFLRWLCQTVTEESVDLVVIAGDVFDRALASEEAVALLDDGLDGLLQCGTKVVMIPGNHDSARRLGFAAKRQAAAGIHVVSADEQACRPRVIECANGAICVAAIPFLDPHSATTFRYEGEGPRTHGSILEAAIATARDSLEGTLSSLLVAHGTVIGATRSESERTVQIGGATAIGADALEGFDVVALGHLHRPQSVNKNDAIAYAGSPLPYSFSENHTKSVRIINIGDNGKPSFSLKEIPVGRKVITLSGPLEAILGEQSYEEFCDYFVSVELDDPIPISQAMEKIQERFSYAVGLRYRNIGQRSEPMSSLSQTGVSVDDPRAVFAAFIEEVRERSLEEWEDQLFRDALEKVSAENK